MRIRMISTRRGADDGSTVRTYEAGAEYELPETERGQDLARVFLREGWAVDANPPEPVEPPASLGMQAEEHLDEAEAERRAARRRRR